MTVRLDSIDRLAGIAEELKGIARILFIMYECEGYQGAYAEHLLFLSKAIERNSTELQGIAGNT